MRAVNQNIMFIPPQRSVSLYWVEKWLMIIDALQIWCLLWVIVAPQLPLHWNFLTYPTLFCNLDVFHLFFVNLDPSNALNTSELGAQMMPRILLAAIPVGIAVLGGLLLSAGSRWVSLAQSRLSAADATETAKDGGEHRRRPTARVSLSRFFAAELEEKDKEQSAARILLTTLCTQAPMIAVHSRLILVVWLFAPICNAVFPVVFCEDQAEVCSETPLLICRVVLGCLTVLLAFFAIQYVGDHVKQHVVAQTDKHHEEYVQQKEIEYMLHVNDSWKIQMLWMFTSFRRECRRVYHRQSLMIVKLTLCLLISLFGTDLFRTQYGLAWVFRFLFPNGFRSSNSLITPGDIALGGSGQSDSPLDRLLENPLGTQMRTILGCTVVFVFAACSFVRLPFRQPSSNVLYVICWLLLVCISSIAFALACTASPLGLFLPANLVPLLKSLHLLTLSAFLVVFCVGVIRTLLPNSASALVTTRTNNLEELTEAQKDEALRQRQKDMLQAKRRLLLRHGARMIHNAWFKVATNTRLARNSLSALWSRGSSCALDEDGALYPSFLDSPWPVSFYEGRYFIVTYPQVLRALKRARNVVDRYLFADKTLVPLTVLDAAHADLQQHLVTFLSLRERHASLSKADERQTALNMITNSSHTELNAALSEAERQLALFDKELGDVDEDSTDADDEEDSDTVSEASAASRMSADTSSETDEATGEADGNRGILALTEGTKGPSSVRCVRGSAGGMLKDKAIEGSPCGGGPEHGTDMPADCHRLECVLSEIRQGRPDKRAGVIFTGGGGAGKKGTSAKQVDSTSGCRQDDTLAGLLDKANRLKEADTRPTLWNPTTDNEWKSLMESLDREAAEGAQKAAEVARKSAELDFESMVLGTRHATDLSKGEFVTEENNVVALPQRLHRGQRLCDGVRSAGTGLLKRQNGGPLEAIDDLLAEMEKEADEENIAEAAGSLEGASCDGKRTLSVDFERPMLPNTTEILEAFNVEGLRGASPEADTHESGHDLAEAVTAQRCSRSLREESEERGSTFPPSTPAEQSSNGDVARRGNLHANDHCTVVEHNDVSVGEGYTDSHQEKPIKQGTPTVEGRRRKRKQLLRDETSFSHLPENARRAALEFKVRRLSTLSHLSQRFTDLPMRNLFNEMHHRQSLNHAFRWILLEAFETLSGVVHITATGGTVTRYAYSTSLKKHDIEYKFGVSNRHHVTEMIPQKFVPLWKLIHVVRLEERSGTSHLFANDPAKRRRSTNGAARDALQATRSGLVFDEAQEAQNSDEITGDTVSVRRYTPNRKPHGCNDRKDAT